MSKRIRIVIIFILSLQFGVRMCISQPMIDSVWFWEETDCDGRNLVEICYILSDDTANISAQMSSDSGMTWDVPLTTLMDTTGDLGEEIVPGEHCFYWEMGIDESDKEGMWTLEVGLAEYRDTLFLSDSFYFAAHNISGLTFDGDNIIVGERDGSPVTIAWYNIEADAIIRTVEVSGCNTAEDLAFAEGRLFMNCQSPGRVFEIDMTTGDIINQSSNSFSSLQGLTYLGNDSLFLNRSGWHFCKIPLELDASDCFTHSFGSGWPEGLAFGNGYIWLARDGSSSRPVLLKIRASDFFVSDSFWIIYGGSLGPEGLAWDGTSLWYANYNTGYVYEYDPLLVISEAISATLPLDSRPPNVDISFSGNSDIYPNDIISLNWIVEDMFWCDESCSLHISWCTSETTIIAMGTNYDWIVPPTAEGCDTFWFWIAVRDSFCNWGYDSCNNFSIQYEQTFACIVCPNPFTPNNDGINDYAQFEFEGMEQNEGMIYIFDIHGHKVKSIDVPEGTNAKINARWYGRDKNDKPLPQGLYLFTIESDGETVCEGTITIAR